MTVLKGEKRFLYLACDQARTVQQLMDSWAAPGLDLSVPETGRLEATLETLVERKLI